MEGEALRKVEADERGIGKGQAGGEKGFLGCGAHGEDVVGLGEGGEAVVVRRVGEGDCAAGEDFEVRRRGEREGRGDWRDYL